MISVDWTMLVQFVNFLVLMFVLNILLYRPLRKVMSDRQEAIDGGHQKARDLDDAINEKVARYESQLQQAKLEGSTLATALRAEATKEESVILGEARGAADKSVSDLKASVAVEAEQARKILSGESKSIASAIASKVLGRNVK